MVLVMDRVKTRKKNVFITKRDEHIFSFLYMFKIASREQLHKKFFPNASLRVALRRLEILRQVNLIKVIPLETETGAFRKAYSLTPRAFKEYIDPNGKCNRQELRSDAKNHDIRLGDIYLSLINYKEVTQYYPENLLQAGLTRNSKVDLTRLHDNGHDAIFLLNKKADTYYPVAIEYEHSSKTQKRYHHFFSKVYTTSRLEAVYYICKSQAVLDKVISIDRKYYADLPVKIFYQLYDEVIKEEKSLVFFSKTSATSTINK